MATAALLAEAKEPPCTVLGRQATVRGLIVYEKTPPAWKVQLITIGLSRVKVTYSSKLVNLMVMKFLSKKSD